MRLALPTTNEFSVTGRAAFAPAATLALDGRTLDGLPLEWSWAVDGGSWSPFSEARQIVIRDPVLWLQGRHVAHVRARVVGLPASLDGTPADVPLLIDTVPPAGSFDDDGIVVAHDNVSPDAALLYRWRSDEGAWSAWSGDPHVPRLPGLQVQARDEAGNMGGLEFHGRTTNPPPPGGCSCDAGGRGSSESGALVVFFVVVGLIAAAAPLAVAGAARRLQSASALVKGDFESPLHEIGRYHDVAIHNGIFHVSAYDDSTGDLAYARIVDPMKSIGWQFVDGIDPTMPADNPGDYRRGVSDPGPDVGMYSSIAVTKSGEPRIAYWTTPPTARSSHAAGPYPGGGFRRCRRATARIFRSALYTQILALDANDKIPTHLVSWPLESPTA